MKPKDIESDSIVTTQDEFKNFLSDREKNKIESSLNPEINQMEGDDGGFSYPPEGDQGDIVSKDKKDKSKFLAKYFKSIN
jgi:hypothetical protein